jgi:hypothetical protein
LRRNIVSKCVVRSQAVGNLHALLPPLQLALVQLLESPKLLKILILVVKIVKINVAHLIKSTGELAPGTLPLCITCLPAGTPKSSTGANVVAAYLSRVRSTDARWPRGHRFLRALFWFIGELKEMATLHAVPITVRYAFQSDAMRMIGCVTAVTEEQKVLSLGRVAYGAWVVFDAVLFYVLAEPLLKIEVGYLLFVLNIVG